MKEVVKELSLFKSALERVPALGPGKRLMPFAVSRMLGKPAVSSDGSNGFTGALTRSSAKRLVHSTVGRNDQSHAVLEKGDPHPFGVDSDRASP